MVLRSAMKREVEEQLRRSEYLLAEAQRLAHIGSWSWDVPNKVVTWSDELYRIFGFQPHEIEPAREAMQLLHADDRDPVMAAIASTFKTKEPFSCFYRIRRHDGVERMVHSRGYLVSDDRGEPLSVFGTTQDVTERKQAEEALRRSEQLLRLVLDAIPVGVALMDPDGDVILSNPASTRIWGGEAIRSAPDRYIKSKGWWRDTARQLEAQDWASVRALVRGETSINEVIDIETYDGVRKTIQNSAVPIRDERQAIVGAVVINEDVSDRITAERELEASASQMQALAGRLVHAQDDERRRIAQLLHETTAQDLAGLKMLLARLNRTSERLSAADRSLLIESMDLVERSMSGVRTLSYLLHPPLLDESGLLPAVRWYVEGFARRSGIKVDLDAPLTMERLPRDVETTLFRVVQEALINIHRHAQSATARLRLRLDEDVTLEVQDDGRGMAPELVARLMSGGGGSGVGIAGIRERLTPLAGALEIESSERGTTVRAVVPLPSRTL